MYKIPNIILKNLARNIHFSVIWNGHVASFGYDVFIPFLYFIAFQLVNS